MSFDLFLVAFRDGEKATADVAAAREVLERFRYHHTPESDAYDIDFDDGTYLEFYGGGLYGDKEPFHGGMFALRRQSIVNASFIFEFSKAAGCVIFPAMEPPCVLLPREDLAAHLPSDLGKSRERLRIDNSNALLNVLKGGFEAWQSFRDRVAGNDHVTGDGA